MSAIDDAFDGLHHMIASGELQPGQRFPPEAQLCDRLQVSRGPLREAVRMLGALGVIESRHGSGTFVSPLEPANIIGALSLTVSLMPIDGLLDLYEVRRVIESHAAAQAASRFTDEHAEALGAILDEIEAAPPGAPASDLDAEFHASIARLAHNDALSTLLDVFRSRSNAYQLWNLPGGAEMKAASDHGHRDILGALKRRDPAGAALAAASHVAITEQWMRERRPQPDQVPASAP
ncbi:FadR/GntR family transcriptional regulator [Agromyces subbeticus]|uniref:FadR/GntR family transcriptional regulator n=1 Tax=Agromyces subbeticus TaxID=293890 RepID=UPI0003B351E0|nr:FadR/GntR family transcriptional regulator [Agromyces subbeticus]